MIRASWLQFTVTATTDSAGRAIGSSAFHQKNIHLLVKSHQTLAEWYAWYGFPSQVLHPVLCSALAVAASHFVRVCCNDRLQNEHAPILHTARAIVLTVLSEQRLILHSAYVILSKHELLFSEQVIPHSAHAIPLSEHRPQNASISSSLP